MRALAAALLSALLVSGCSQESGRTAAPPTPVTASEDDPGPMVDLHIVCSGSAGPGRPTVVLIAGLDTSGEVFTDLADRLSPSTRTCWYDRAGIGSSPPQDDEWPDPSPASQSSDLHAALAMQGVDPPYVVLGWSYGGLVAQAYALQHRDAVVGVVLEDTSVREQFTDPVLMNVDEEVGVHWTEGGRDIDVRALEEELADVDFGRIPVVVLSQDARGDWGRSWLGYHRRLADASSQGLHVIGVGSGHAMHQDVPDLVAAAVVAEVDAVSTATPLGACDARFTDTGGRCPHT